MLAINRHGGLIFRHHVRHFSPFIAMPFVPLDNNVFLTRIRSARWRSIRTGSPLAFGGGFIEIHHNVGLLGPPEVGPINRHFCIFRHHVRD